MGARQNSIWANIQQVELIIILINYQMDVDSWPLSFKPWQQYCKCYFMKVAVIGGGGRREEGAK